MRHYCKTPRLFLSKWEDGDEWSCGCGKVYKLKSFYSGVGELHNRRWKEIPKETILERVYNLEHQLLPGPYNHKDYPCGKCIGNSLLTAKLKLKYSLDQK